jgi:subtilisin family serine protease
MRLRRGLLAIASEIKMKKLVHVNALTAAVGVALLGIGLSSSVSAAQPSLGVAQSAATEISSIGQYIVTFAEPGLLHYSGGVQGLSATAPKTLGARKLDAQSPAARAYATYLDTQRAAHVTEIESRLGRPLDITHSYGVIRNGVAVALTPEELAKVAATPGVVSVRAVKVYTPETYRGPKFIGADTLWNGTNVPGGSEARGTGIKIGVIDTGTNSTHPSFANDETCGFSAANPKLHAFDCNTSSAGACTGSNPEAPVGANDVLGHGVHTSSTAGGNFVDNTANPAPDLPDGVKMSGVAPCATVYSYKVAAADGSLPSSAINAAIEAIVTDGVDVANFSIGPTCGGGSPWNDSDRDFLEAINNDIFVAASAGNTRTACPSPVGRVSHTGPWMTTVAASTQDQTIGQGTFEVTGPEPVPALIQSFGGTMGNTTDLGQVQDLTGYPMRTYPTNIAGCTATGGFPANYFQGAIAVIRRGATPPATTACSFTEKINNAAAAGAVLVVIANNKNDVQGMDTTGATLASFKINDLATSDALIDFVNANNGGTPDPDVIFANGFDTVVPSGAVADFTKGTSLVTVQGDVLGAFSFRGPTSGAVADLTKPDITGPGVNIYAAGRPQDNNYMFMGGTSMSSPHVAGAAALIREIHPDWTVAEVKSALMTTAFQTGFQEDGITPWTADQVGSGRVDLTKAAKAGLTLDETYQRFVDANPSGGTVALKDLNIPSVRNANCQTSCTWTRTVKNQLSTSGSWNATATGTGFGLTVSPATFTLAPGATQELTITATPTGTLSNVAFGQVNLVEASGQSPDQHITAAVKGAGGGGGTAVGVECAGGDCTFQIDTLGTQFSSIGCQTQYCGMLWLNRYTPDPTDYPITITSVSTIFAAGNGSNVAGDKINVYVYQDNDDDPSNGATLVGSQIGYVMGAPANSFATITLTAPIVVNGPGDVLIALTNPAGNTGFNPASADTGPFLERSWFAAYDDTVAGTNPNLATAGLVPNPDAISGFSGNWLIRATGTNGSNQPLVLDPRSGRDQN